MDLPFIEWQDHVTQKWTRLDLDLKEQFTSLLEIDDVFKFALALITQDDLDFVQSVSAGYSVQKDTKQAAKCREAGNNSFKTRDYTAAGLHYSQGICFAPQSSEQLSLCYANRSAVLYHLQRYQECLDDIDRAVKNGYPSHLLHKLEDRRGQCVKHFTVDHHNPSSKNCKSPGGEKASPVPPLTVGILAKASIGFSVEKGRHLVADEKIATGEVILNDRPFSCVLIPQMLEVKGKRATGVSGTEHRRCHMCLTETLVPVPCDRCCYSRYCSTVCQQAAWKEHHRWECPLGAELIVMGVMSHLALRVTLKAGLNNIQLATEPIGDERTKSEPSCRNREPSDSDPRHLNQPHPPTSHYGDTYSSIFHLLHHLSHHSPGLRFLYSVTIATLYVKLSETGPPPESWQLRRTAGANSLSPNEEGGNVGWTSELRLLGSVVLRHYLQLRSNAQAIMTLQDTGAENSPVQSSREIRIATAVFPTLSLLNHSCSPNTSLVFNTGAGAAPSCSDPLAELELEHRSAACGVTVTVRAAKAIGAGEEILHCYGPHSSRMVTQERRRLLQEQYHFLCQCETCTGTQEEGEQQRSGQHKSRLLCVKCRGFLKKNSEERNKEFTCSQSSCGHCVSSSELGHRLQEIRLELDKAVDLMERERPDEALTLLKKTQAQSGLILADTHPLQGELADAMARAYATVGDWNKAAFYLEQSRVAIGCQFGGDSIELGRQLFKLAQLHFNGGARGPALSVIPKVRRLLCLHCGPHCHELQELQAMEDCLRG
ncbi:SET and MYND domain-containing protein 4 [Betta splendens]|uniref:Protein-lysine N-methyltransferase SMYD4 n=1 Tax=Betta splendens TaxID=158456 RepID=A0A6P7PD75_BETSP|nr:SET and MYND domain-containing protein 4 [Betta splendens]